MGNIADFQWHASSSAVRREQLQKKVVMITEHMLADLVLTNAEKRQLQVLLWDYFLAEVSSDSINESNEALP